MQEDAGSKKEDGWNRCKLVGTCQPQGPKRTRPEALSRSLLLSRTHLTVSVGFLPLSRHSNQLFLVNLEVASRVTADYLVVHALVGLSTRSPRKFIDTTAVQTITAASSRQLISIQRCPSCPCSGPPPCLKTLHDLHRPPSISSRAQTQPFSALHSDVEIALWTCTARSPRHCSGDKRALYSIACAGPPVFPRCCWRSRQLKVSVHVHPYSLFICALREPPAPYTLKVSVRPAAHQACEGGRLSKRCRRRRWCSVLLASCRSGTWRCQGRGR